MTQELAAAPAIASVREMAETVARIDYYRHRDLRMQRERAHLIAAIHRTCTAAAVAAQAEMEQARAALISARAELDAELAGEGHFATITRLDEQVARARADYVVLRDVWISLVAKGA